MTHSNIFSAYQSCVMCTNPICALVFLKLFRLEIVYIISGHWIVPGLFDLNHDLNHCKNHVFLNFIMFLMIIVFILLIILEISDMLYN